MTTKTANQAASLAFGAWYGAESNPSPFRRIFYAASFVSSVLDPKGGVLKFLLVGAKLPTSRGKGLRSILTARPRLIVKHEWEQVTAVYLALIEKTEENYKMPNQKKIDLQMRKIREQTKACQNIYAYLAFVLDVRSTSERKTLHKQVKLRLDRSDINTERKLLLAIDNYTPKNVREAAAGGQFDEVGVAERLYLTRGYNTLLKTLEKYNLKPETATILDLRELVEKAMKTQSTAAAELPVNDKTSAADKKRNSATAKTDKDYSQSPRRSKRTKIVPTKEQNQSLAEGRKTILDKDMEADSTIAAADDVADAESVAEGSVGEESVAEGSAAEESVDEESVAEESVGEESVAEGSAAEESVAEELVAEESVDEESVDEGSVGGESGGGESGYEESVFDELVDEESDVDDEEFLPMRDKVANGKTLRRLLTESRKRTQRTNVNAAAKPAKKKRRLQKDFIESRDDSQRRCTGNRPQRTDPKGTHALRYQLVVQRVNATASLFRTAQNRLRGHRRAVYLCGRQRRRRAQGFARREDP